MRLNRLRLRHFRTYDTLDLRLSPGVTILHGWNATGKSNILEAIFALATTRSFRARTDRDLIAWEGAEEGVPRHTRVAGDAEARNGPVRLSLMISEVPRGADGAMARKQFRINGKAVRASEVVGAIKAVLFSPDDTALITASPSVRRRFMDLMLCQIDHRYLRLLQEYSRVVTQRNSLLQQLRGRPDPSSLLSFWDERLIGIGVDIMIARKDMLRLLSAFAAEAYTDLAGIDERLQVVYRPSLEGAAEAQHVELSGLFAERLGQLQSKEIYQGVTLAGPHRDDLQMLIDGADAQYFASRGQQRSIALALRLAELHYMTNRTGEQPILLLDEALAELDDDRQRLLLRLAEQHPQVLITTSHLAGFPSDFRDRARLIEVQYGRAIPELPEQRRAV
ncbi:MAG: DNA replication/repair protein RecF [Chloroflexota bacterium]